MQIYDFIRNYYDCCLLARHIVSPRGEVFLCRRSFEKGRVTLEVAVWTSTPDIKHAKAMCGGCHTNFIDHRPPPAPRVIPYLGWPT